MARLSGLAEAPNLLTQAESQLGAGVLIRRSDVVAVRSKHYGGSLDV